MMLIGYTREGQLDIFTMNISTSEKFFIMFCFAHAMCFIPFLVCRWDDFDTSPVTWHIDQTANIKSDPISSSSYITTVEPWQSAINGIY